MKIRPVGDKLFRADGRTDRQMTKRILASHKFGTAQKLRGTAISIADNLTENLKEGDRVM